MNVHTSTTEIPDCIKPMVANAEAFRDAITDPGKKKVVQEWQGQAKKSHKGQSGEEPGKQQIRGRIL